MNRVLTILGVVMLAAILFLGLVHLFLKVQHKDSRETLTSLHAMPVIGGFFSAPPAEVPEPSMEEKREARARQNLLDSREFFALPDGFDRGALDDLVSSVKDALTRYEQGLKDVENERADLARIRAEVDAAKEALESGAKDLAERAMDLERGREELDLRANRMAADEARNLKGSSLMYEQMAPEAASQVLDNLDVDMAAKILKGMSVRKSAKILGAMPAPKAVEITKRLQVIAVDPPAPEKRAVADR